MKVIIDQDEWYPVYTFETNKGMRAYISQEHPKSLVEIDKKTYKRLRKAELAFDAAQKELAELYTGFWATQ